MKIFRGILCCLLLGSPLVYAAHSDSSVKQVVKELKGKTVFLRGMEAGDKLVFDAQGAEVGTYQTGSFAYSAATIDKVHLSKRKLEIHAMRVFMIFDPASHSRSLDAIHFITFTQPVTISIAVNPSDLGALEAAVQKILAFSVQDDLAGKTSDEVKATLATVVTLQLIDQEHPLPPAMPKSNPVFKDGAYTVGIGVTPPRLIHYVDPVFPLEERNRHLQGLCVITVAVDTEGQPARILIRRSAGFDFDAAAIAAASQYRFKPALYQGKPVPVWINVEVNFRIY